MLSFSEAHSKARFVLSRTSHFHDFDKVIEAALVAAERNEERRRTRKELDEELDRETAATAAAREQHQAALEEIRAEADARRQERYVALEGLNHRLNDAAGKRDAAKRRLAEKRAGLRKAGPSRLSEFRAELARLEQERDALRAASTKPAA